MSRVLITNGDHAANALAAHFPDAEILIWRDVLIEGPVPGGVSDEALSDIRAKYLEDAFGLNDVRTDFTRRDKLLAAIPESARIELWFETDLHDQLQLIQILDRFRTKFEPDLWMTIGTPPLPDRIGRMERSITPVTEQQFTEAALLWAAFRSPGPDLILEVIDRDGPLPAAQAALYRMLEHYPYEKDGLGDIERKALVAIRDGAITPGLAFRHYQQAEALAFLGDLGFYSRLDALQFCRTPLLTGLPQGGIATASRTNMSVEYTHTPIELTDSGHAVLEQRADHMQLNEIDRWIGGVHLTSESIWRFNGKKTHGRLSRLRE